MSDLVACHHDVVTRLAPLYVDGRPLYRCDECGARFTYEDDEPSFKGLAELKGGASSVAGSSADRKETG